MIRSSKEPDLTAKQEAETSDGKISKVTSTSWSKLKDPRIVRASRAFGGKDRHSKVSTVRGLRDRRVRLSLPTAIQLYDLQDRLGFNQPSKVVDWLLDAAKHEIDELPPLPIHPSNFTLNHQPVLASRAAGAPQSKIASSINWDHLLDLSRPNIWSSEAAFKHKSKEIARETTDDKDNSSEENEEDKPSDPQGHAEYASPSNNFFPITNHSSFQGLLNNVLQCNSFLRWDPSNLSLSHPGSQGLTSQAEDVPNFNAVPMPFGATQPYFPSQATAAAVELDSRQSDFHMLTSSSQNLLSNSLVPSLYPPHQTLRPFQLTMKPKYLFSLNHGGSGTNKDTKE